MATLRGISKLNTIVTKQVAPFGITKAVISDEYSYIRPNQSITFKITENEIEDIWFQEFVKQRFDYEIKRPFIFFLLHEIGHHITDDDIDDDLYDYCLQEKNIIDEEMEKADDEYSKILEWRYFNLPEEIYATEWAVNFAKKNPDTIEEMWNECKKAFLTFYKENDIIDLSNESEE